MSKKKTGSRAFGKLKAGLEDAIAHHRGRRVLTVRDLNLPKPPKPLAPEQVAAVRRALHLSQAAFARVLNVSARTVQAWEIGAVGSRNIPPHAGHAFSRGGPQRFSRCDVQRGSVRWRRISGGCAADCGAGVRAGRPRVSEAVGRSVPVSSIGSRGKERVVRGGPSDRRDAGCDPGRRGAGARGRAARFGRAGRRADPRATAGRSRRG